MPAVMTPQRISWSLEVSWELSKCPMPRFLNFSSVSLWSHIILLQRLSHAWSDVWGPCNSVMETVPCLVRCLATPLALTYMMPVTPAYLVTITKTVFGYCQMSPGVCVLPHCLGDSFTFQFSAHMSPTGGHDNGSCSVAVTLLGPLEHIICL